MMKLTVLYTQPSDPEAFDDHYAAVHTPLVKAMPGLLRVETAKAAGAPGPYWRTADLYFPDADAMGAAFGSEEGKATLQDADDLVERTGSTMSTVTLQLDD